MVILVVASIFLVEKVNAQNQTTDDIADRLLLKGVPVKHVTTINRIPYEIEIALQSSSDNDRINVDDNWFMQLAKREAKLAYRTGPPVSSYQLVVYNTKGEIISSGQTWLYPTDLSQQLPPPAIPKVDNETAKEIVESKLKLGGLSLDVLDVISDDTPGSNGQILLIQVSLHDFEKDKPSLSTFWDSFMSTLHNINEDFGTYIILGHLRVIDSDGTVILDYVNDVETGSAQSTGFAGVDLSFLLGGPEPTSPATQKPTPGDPYPSPPPRDIPPLPPYPQP
jgi:hypothetical protein